MTNSENTLLMESLQLLDQTGNHCKTLKKVQTPEHGAPEKVDGGNSKIILFRNRDLRP
jgi:hypothetical protein